MKLAFLSILYKMFTPRDKKVMFFLLLLSVFVSIVETIGISAIMIFVSISTNLGAIHHSKHFGYLYNFLGFSNHKDFVIFLGLSLLVFYAFRMLLNTFHIYSMNRFAYMRQLDFSKRLFKKFLFFRYRDFVQKNPAQLNQTIVLYPSNVTQIVAALLNIIAEMITVGCIYVMLFYVNWKMTLILTFLLLAKIIVIIKVFSGRIRKAGEQNKHFSMLQGRAWGETYGNYKFLKLLSNEEIPMKRFSYAGDGLARAGIVNLIWQALPRYVLETIGFSILIGVILYVVFMYNDAGFVVPIVSMYALTFYRFLPSVNKILMGYNQIMFNHHAPKPIWDFLQHDFENLGGENIEFNRDISIVDMSFSYSEKSRVFRDAKVSIEKGQRVGFVGESGAGKSTLADIIMGLLNVDKGKILIDGELLSQRNIKAWRRNIGYIPQLIYLFDGTVADNVVCGRHFDEQQIIASLRKARIYDFLATKDGIHTLVGEGGIRFSGGQKQRVAITRALYDNPDVLVLDEATSALDNETEENIMNEIYDVSADKTLIIIAHRLTTIERCDKVYRVEDHKIFDVTSTFSKTSGVQSVIV